MVPIRTISIASVATPGVAPGEPVSWIVKVDGHEFVHGHEHALAFDSREQAALFAADLLLEYGPETQINLVGLDSLGIPLPEPLETLIEKQDVHRWLQELKSVTPEKQTPFTKIEDLICKMLFCDAPAKDKVKLIVYSYGGYLRAIDKRFLNKLEPAFVIAHLKQILPKDAIRFAEISAALRKIREQHIE